MPNVLFVAESRDGALRKVAFEVATAARELADALGGEAHALLTVASGGEKAASALGEFGADAVFVAEHPSYSEHNPGSVPRLVAEVVAKGGYGAVLFAASAHGRDLAPRAAACMGVGLAADVISIDVVGGAIQAKHPINTGKVIATLRLEGNPAVLSLRPNMFTPSASARSARIERLSGAPQETAGAMRVSGMAPSGAGAKPDLSEAPVIVSGGRGLKAPENFSLVEDLASAFGNAAVGCTRAVSDAGWRPHSDQIGQTGRTVSPDLYVAVGISGAIQHIAGMRNSRTIVAINKDKEAPIFKVADYGIVGDVFEVVPVLTAAVKEARKSD